MFDPVILRQMLFLWAPIKHCSMSTLVCNCLFVCTSHQMVKHLIHPWIPSQQHNAWHISLKKKKKKAIKWMSKLTWFWFAYFTGRGKPLNGDVIFIFLVLQNNVRADKYNFIGYTSYKWLNRPCLYWTLFLSSNIIHK